jgi:hypothetical protein
MHTSPQLHGMWLQTKSGVEQERSKEPHYQLCDPIGVIGMVHHQLAAHLELDIDRIDHGLVCKLTQEYGYV